MAVSIGSLAEDIWRRRILPVWEALTSNERVRVVRLLVAGVNDDGIMGK
jgi:hypothetical protein